MARWKTNAPLRRSAWSAAHRAANCVVDRPPRWRFESSLRFEGASDMEAKAIESVDSIALACLTISQDHVLIDRSPGSAIPIVYDDRDGCRRAACDGVRRRRLLRRLTRRENSPPYQTLSTEGARGPPEASDVRDDDGGRPWPPLPPGGRATIVERNWTAFDGLRRASRV